MSVVIYKHKAVFKSQPANDWSVSPDICMDYIKRSISTKKKEKKKGAWHETLKEENAGIFSYVGNN